MNCEVDTNRITSEVFTKVFRAYMECSDEVQGVIKSMVSVATADDATEDEKDAAYATIEDALFPKNHGGQLGIDLEEEEAVMPPQTKSVLHELKQEEATFSERLARFMDDRGMTQADLAQAIGVGQPAISMMLARECRPQRRTVEKIARALKISVEDIWPGFKED
jgi:DNA-binding XRE family transcriptional regulator